MFIEKLSVQLSQLQSAVHGKLVQLMANVCEVVTDCVAGTMLRPKQPPPLHSWYCRHVNKFVTYVHVCDCRSAERADATEQSS